jgi:plastocyanin
MPTNAFLSFVSLLSYVTSPIAILTGSITINRARRFRVTALALCLVLAAPATLYAQTVHKVRVARLTFVPDMLTIEAGDTVQWFNPKGGARHDVVSYDNAWAPSILASEFIFEVTFPRVGEFRYFCTPHESYGMIGTITVVENVPGPGYSRFRQCV